MRIQPKVYLMPNLNIAIYECDTQYKIFSKITLNKFYSFFHSDIFDSSKNYYMIIEDAYIPMGYNLILISEGFQIKNMSRNNIYQQILNYKTKDINIDFPSLEKNKVWLFGKILIRNNSKNKANLRFKLNIKYSIKKIFPFIHVYLENENIQSKRREIMLNEFVNLYQDNFNNFENQTKNYITITIKPEFILKNDNIGIEILYDNEDFTFELVDIIQPYEITGIPEETNNNGLIFSQYIYPSENEIASFINLNIINEDKDNKLFNECDFKLELYHLTNEPNFNFELNSIHFSYSNVGELLKSESFYNSITLSNIIFYIKKPLEKEESKEDNIKIKEKGKKDIETYFLPYLLICYINDRENNNFKLDKIKWNIRIFSDHIISFVKDTSKINHENKIKNEWEIGHEGRKIKAIESRKKFLALTKKKLGFQLTKDETELLMKTKRRKSLNEQENEDIKNNVKDNTKENKIKK